MKKYLFLSLMAFATLGTTVSCDRSTEVVQQTDNDTYPMMRDIRGTFNAANQYTISQGINIQTTDVVLVYRNINSGNSNGAVWQLLPKTEYLSNSRELDYNFLFNTIAPVYGLFYQKQKQRYREIVRHAGALLDATAGEADERISKARAQLEGAQADREARADRRGEVERGGDRRGRAAGGAQFGHVGLQSIGLGAGLRGDG